MTARRITLVNAQQAWAALQTAYESVKADLLVGKRFEVSIKPETRSIQANARMWAMLADIARQVDWYGQKLSSEDWKHVFSAALKRTRVCPGIDGGFVVLGQSTSQMTRTEMSEMQGLMEAFGAERGVRFTAPECEGESV